MEEIMYEFGGYSVDHNLEASEYFEWPSPASVPTEYYGSAGNIMSWESTNLQEEDHQKNIIRAKISSHPFYPKLLLTYLDCYKVAGAPPELVNRLDNIVQENDLHRISSSSSTALNRPITDDSELDDFMVTYCDVLAKFKLDLGRSFKEATTFLNDIQTQLTNLSTTTNISELVAEKGDRIGGGDGGGGEANKVDEQKKSSSDEICRSGREIKNKLMRKYSGYISSLKHDFCKKNNKGKLPRQATQILHNWWTTHYNWPYPTEVDKVCLAESTGLDPKQINNWFINQRKRHWKPSENMQFAVMKTIYGHFS